MRYSRTFPGLPLYVVENGMPTDDGKPRPDRYTRSDHLRDHVYWLERARSDGAPVIGYNYWSITDNYEWGTYRPRFGLFTVDALTDPTLTRRPTEAVTTYRDLVANGSRPATNPNAPPHSVPSWIRPSAAPIPRRTVDAEARRTITWCRGRCGVQCSGPRA